MSIHFITIARTPGGTRMQKPASSDNQLAAAGECRDGMIA
jgi:hypothetical protein